MPDPFYMEDVQSHVWKKLEAYLEERLQRLRAQNDQRLDDYDTALLRGRIAEIKEILKLSAKRPEFVSASAGDIDEPEVTHG